ncbi:DUF5983 family protein [Pseudomonas sp. SBT1-2]|uniref:DUF5983 family protein n=1 Tax=Pseudomonas sp. SBT1-2 TaxID=3027852 RepID=UPI00235ECFB6|nr:ABC transporter substrate-binding protein [Pseudomonas sp. SBT1-2]
MTANCNPFVRGYQNLRIERELCISFADDCPSIHRPIHPSQTHLVDTELELCDCLFCDDFALVTDGHAVEAALKDHCPSAGTVLKVVYGLVGEQFDKPVLIGDNYSMQQAQKVMHSLTFETGFYSRCWEISTAHLDENGRRFLCDLVDCMQHPSSLFVSFRIPFAPSIGIKLIATPWTDENLQGIEEMTIQQLRQEHSDSGMPKSLIEVLHLAGQADVRILVFDADAPVLADLAIYEDE